MKRYFSIIYVGIMLLLSGYGCLGYAASTGALDVTGEIRVATCYFDSVEGQDHRTYSWTLPAVSISSLKVSGDTAMAQQGKINIGGSYCTDGITPQIYFDYASNQVNIDPNTGNLINLDTNGAKNAEVQLLNKELAPLDLRTSPSVDCDTISGNQSTCTLGYQYYATDQVTAGVVKSSVIFTVTYY